MIVLHRIAFFFSCWSASIQVCSAALPTTEAVGNLLGYPPSELLIEDTTAQERSLMQTPSAREQRGQTFLPDPANLLKAYRIHGNNKYSFFPIQVYIGVKDAFLTPEVMDRLAKGDAMPKSQRTSTSEGFESIGKGGAFITPYHKVKYEGSSANYPDMVVATISVVQPHGQEFDIKIAQRASLGQGEELQRIPAGETYYNTFGPSRDIKAEPRLDSAKSLLELHKIVIAEWQAEKGANGVVPPKQPSSPQQTPPSKQPVVAPQTEPTSTASSSAGKWWLGGLALAVLVFIAHAIRKRRH